MLDDGMERLGVGNRKPGRGKLRDGGGLVGVDSRVRQQR